VNFPEQAMHKEFVAEPCNAFHGAEGGEND